MKPYGMTKLAARDLDAFSCGQNGRPTRVYNLKDRSYRSLRNGKKASKRRVHKRRAHQEGKKECMHGIDS